MKKIFIASNFLIFANILSAQTTYNVSGKLKGFDKSALIYLSDLSDGSYRDIDSAELKNGAFKFSGTIEPDITKFAIHSKGFADRISFWIDATPVHIEAEKGQFKAAKVTGSKTQTERLLLESIIDSAKSKKRAYIQFIQQNPKSIVSADILNIYSASWNKDTVESLYRLLQEPAKSSQYGQLVERFLLLNKEIKIGKRYVDFAEKNMEGRTVRLSDYDGKIVLLEFWGSWCMPCREGHPELVSIYNEFKPQGFEILGIAADVNKDFLLDAIRKDKLPWQNLSDLQGDRTQAAVIYGVSYYPANFLIDRNGTIVAKDLRGEKLKQKITELLNLK